MENEDQEQVALDKLKLEQKIISEQRKLAEQESREKARRLFAENARVQVASFTDATSSYFLATTRGAFLLNGGAAVTILSRQETLTTEGRLIVLICAIGAMFSVICSAVGFAHQWFTRERYVHVMNKYTSEVISRIITENPEIDKLSKKIFYYYYIGITSYSLSVICFILSLFLFPPI